MVHDLKDMKTAEIEKNYLSDKSAGEGHLVTLELYRGEALAPITEVVIDNKFYLKCRYSGVYHCTSAVKSHHPNWNTLINLACTLPN